MIERYDRYMVLVEVMVEEEEAKEEEEEEVIVVLVVEEEDRYCMILNHTHYSTFMI